MSAPVEQRMETFAVNLRELRLHTGRTLRDMQAITGIAISYLSSIERGEGRNVSLGHAMKLADVFGLSVDDMTRGPVASP